MTDRVITGWAMLAGGLCAFTIPPVLFLFVVLDRQTFGQRCADAGFNGIAKMACVRALADGGRP